MKDLKDSIKTSFKIKNKKDMNACPSAINWRYVWRNFCISHKGVKLVDSWKKLRDYGVKNKEELEFFKFKNSKVKNDN